MGHGLGAWRRAVALGALVATGAAVLLGAPRRETAPAESRRAARPGTGPVPALPPEPVFLGPPPSPTVLAAAGDRPILPPPDRFDAPARPAAPPPRALQGGAPAGPPTGTGVWAVIIGINDYPGTRADLRSAVADARDVDEALARYGVPAHQRLLVRDRQASAAVVRAAVAWLVRNAGPSATAVFFYAGHVRKLGRGREAIVAADGGVVDDTELAARLAGLRAAETWIGMAACYGGGFTELLGPGRVLTAAAGADELAYENEGFGRSYLVEYMVRRAMIQRAAPTSVQAAFGWARDAIARDYPGRVPVIADSSDGDVDLRQPGYAPAPAGGAGSPPPRQPAPGAPPSSAPPPREDACADLMLGIVSCR